MKKTPSCFPQPEKRRAILSRSCNPSVFELLPLIVIKFRPTMGTGETSDSVESETSDPLLTNKNVMRKTFFHYWILIKHQNNTQFFAFQNP